MGLGLVSNRDVGVRNSKGNEGRKTEGHARGQIQS